MNKAEEKKALRQCVSLLKKQLTPADKQAAAERVAKVLLANSRLLRSRQIVAYWSLTDELPTHQLVDILSETHEVFLPVVVGDRLELRLYEGRKKMQCEPRFGIEEPTSNILLPDNALNITIITPGVAFTPMGHRLGRGGGFYDRVFATQKHAYRIGIAFECQRVTNLPTEPHDQMMDEVVFG